MTILEKLLLIKLAKTRNHRFNSLYPARAKDAISLQEDKKVSKVRRNDEMSGIIDAITLKNMSNTENPTETQDIGQVATRPLPERGVYSGKV
jgi:hypothetical protein